MAKNNIPFYKQETDYSCGLASMRMVLESLGIKYTEKKMESLMHFYQDKIKSVWHNEFPTLAKKLGLDFVVKTNSTIVDLKSLLKKDYRIIVAYFIPEENIDHYAVIKKIDKKNIHFLDPWFGPGYKCTQNYFKEIWFDLEYYKGWVFALKK